ncbi:uncharacterized protein LOC134311943 [Trichomycterus rosablanca]|uniref:uncharacterized protein LOC134311943 n=1 Tax=Trichomycterus rosablanca TaxID=2290929 RepID=UPI002F357BD9
MTKFIRKLCGRFLKVEALQSRAVDEIHYKDPSNQLPGDITPQQVERFHQAALAFLIGAVEYAIAKLPLKETLLKHARFVDVQQRTECEVNDAAYFVERFPELLPYHGPQEHDQLSEEFLDYQLMDIPMPQDPAMFDIEAFWGNITALKNRTESGGLINMGSFISYFFGENSTEVTDLQESGTSSPVESSSPNPETETSDLPQTQNETVKLPDIQNENLPDGINSFTSTSDLTGEAEKINIFVKHAGKSQEFSIFPLEKISSLLQEACKNLHKKPENMGLIFQGERLDVTKMKCHYPELRRGATVHLIRVS